MKKNAMDAVATLWRKDPNSENGLLTNAVKLENEAVFGRLEEPLIVAPDMEARRGNSHVERCPVGGLSRKASHQQRGGTTMEVLYPRCSGLDVHKRFVVACLSVVEANGQRHKELRQFGTMTSEILELKDWLKASGCRQVAMESTGVYWKPIFHLLEGEFEIVLVNAQHMKAVPGRKTDLKDAEWIADLLQHGLLKASFIPSSEQQAVRDLTRSRMSLTQERNRLINRVQKVLEDANIKLASVVSDLMGKTGHAILMALVAGEVDPEYLARLAQGRLVKKQAQLQAALAGKLTAHHRMLLRELLELLAVLDHSIDRFDREIAERLRPYDALIERIDSRCCPRRIMGGDLSRTTGNRRETTQWPHPSRQSLGENGPRPSGTCCGAYPDVSGGTISSDQCATRGQASCGGRRSQYPGHFLSDGQDR
jgi:transposase